MDAQSEPRSRRLVRSWGWESFRFDWIVDPDVAISRCAIAAISAKLAGFSMAIFLAGATVIDGEIINGKSTERPPGGLRSIVCAPEARAFFTASHRCGSLALRCFDLMVAMTGRPGSASDLPTNFFYQFAFGRSRLGFAAASGIMIFVMVVAVMLPFIIWELRHERRRER